MAWLQAELSRDRMADRRIVTTNGCFDWLHPGHIEFLSLARQQGDCLIVLLNSDASVRQSKGASHPLIPEDHRATVLLGLRAVDYVVLLDNVLPGELLSEIRPNVHCKGGDYDSDCMPETPIVQALGGEVRILPLVAGYSTSELIDRLLSQTQGNDAGGVQLPGSRPQDICRALLAGSNVLRQTAYLMRDRLAEVADLMCQTIQAGNKILVCGNGGSAADAQHFSAELVGRYRVERAGWPAVALTVDTSVLTGIANDYGFEQVFARQVEALGQPDDLLLAISTSGRSPNILQALATAQRRNLHTILLTGARPLSATMPADVILPVPSEDTPLIQQAHIAVLHLLCELIEQRLTP